MYLDQFFGRLPRYGHGTWSELGDLQEGVNRLFADTRLGRTRRHLAYPPINLWSDQERIYLTAELPGIDPKDLDISVIGNTVTLKGSRAEETLAEGSFYHHRERPTGEFVRTFELPFAIDAEKVAADYRDGLLCVTLQRPEAEKPRKITVKAG